jgi:hypothetical protein
MRGITYIQDFTVTNKPEHSIGIPYFGNAKADSLDNAVYTAQ